MSVVITVTVGLPLSVSLGGALMTAAAATVAAMLNLTLEKGAKIGSAEGAGIEAAREQCVDIGVNNSGEVSGGLNMGESIVFSGDGVKVVFCRDEQGKTVVRAHGKGSKAELQALGEKVAQAIVQQYAYHRLISEMKARNMNVVDECVEEDGSVRMQVRVFQG